MRSLLLLLALLVTCCSTTAPYVWATELPPATERAHHAIRPGDKLQIVVYGQDTMSGEFEVRPGGNVVFPVVGSVQAKDRLPEELAALAAQRLRGVLANPIVTILITSRRPPNVSVLGEVTTSGRYELRDGDGVLEALARAGGLTAFADRDNVYVIRRGTREQRIRFRYSDLSSGIPRVVAFELLDGDVVLVQ